eukprot:720401-Pleurochrysis_carterae.AAC.3
MYAFMKSAFVCNLFCLRAIEVVLFCCSEAHVTEAKPVPHAYVMCYSVKDWNRVRSARRAS